MPIKVTDYISPTAEIDTYPTHFDRYQKGGFRVVATVAERDAITTERKTVGMWVYVSDDDDLFKWNGVSWDLIDKANVTDVLTKTNSTIYTPTANYHPATKKYVDDNIGGGGGSTSIFLQVEDRYPDGYFERNYILDNSGNKLTEEIL